MSSYAWIWKPERRMMGTAAPAGIAEVADALSAALGGGIVSTAPDRLDAYVADTYWPALHAAGFTPRQLLPWERSELLACRCGVTNLVARATVAADELDDDELRAGRARLARKVQRYRPRVVAVVGIGAYRVAFDRPKARLGRQPDDLAGVPVWVLPNTSGLNANHRPADFAKAFRELKDAVLRLHVS